MRRQLSRLVAGGALAAALVIAGATSASAQQTTWTQTSCNSNGSYTYTNTWGGTIVTASSVGGTFFGTEGQLVRAVADTMAQ